MHDCVASCFVPYPLQPTTHCFIHRENSSKMWIMSSRLQNLSAVLWLPLRHKPSQMQYLGSNMLPGPCPTQRQRLHISFSSHWCYVEEGAREIIRLFSLLLYIGVSHEECQIVTHWKKTFHNARHLSLFWLTTDRCHLDIFLFFFKFWLHKFSLRWSRVHITTWS